MLPVIAFLCAIASCVLGFLLQKNCKPTSIRFHGKKIEIAKKMVVADVYEVFIKNGKYYAKCSVPGESTQQIIEIDKAMMAAFPDQQDSDKPAIRVMLYEEATDVGMKIYTLAPEEIRFKFNLHIVQDEKKTLADIQNASWSIGGYYQVRLVLWTLAWVGVYRSPILSILFSAFAAIISVRNIIPLRCTILKKCGIINTNNEGENSKAKADMPPGFDNWSAESQYMYSLEQRIKSSKKASAVEAAESSEASDVVASADVTDIETAAPDESESDISKDEDSGEEDVEMPFFTDEELSQEGEDAEEEEAEDAEPVSPSPDSADLDDEDSDDDGFEADGFEADDAEDKSGATDAETQDKATSTENDETVQTTSAANLSSPNPHPKKRGGKKTIKSVLDDLMDDTSE